MMSTCTCDPNPGSTEGPEVDCPEHGINAETVAWLHANGLCPVRTPAEALATVTGRVHAHLTEQTAPELYPPRCSQCGKQWIDQACGPTHAIVANELGLNEPTARSAASQRRVEGGGSLTQLPPCAGAASP